MMNKQLILIKYMRKKEKNVNDYIVNIFLPLFTTFVFSWLVGFERQNVGKSAGISAHVLVSMAACAIAVMQRQMFVAEFAAGKPNPDGQRVIAQVVTGIGFLGAGVILKSNKNVKGLTTAATIWTCAMLGIIIGMEYWQLGLTLGVFIVLFIYIRDISRGFNPFIAHKHENDESQHLDH